MEVRSECNVWRKASVQRSEYFLTSHRLSAAPGPETGTCQLRKPVQ